MPLQVGRMKSPSPSIALAFAAALTLAAAFGLCPSVAGADADATASPIKVDHCTMAEQAAMVNPKIGLRLATAAGLTIVYTNERDVAAGDIHFRVRYAGSTLTFVDRGTFAPHAKISREFDSFSAVFSGSAADCSVTSATFVDGTRWDAPVAGQTPAAHR